MAIIKKMEDDLHEHVGEDKGKSEEGKEDSGPAPKGKGKLNLHNPKVQIALGVLGIGVTIYFYERMKGTSGAVTTTPTTTSPDNGGGGGNLPDSSNSGNITTTNNSYTTTTETTNNYTSGTAGSKGKHTSTSKTPAFASLLSTAQTSLAKGPSTLAGVKKVQAQTTAAVKAAKTPMELARVSTMTGRANPVGSQNTITSQYGTKATAAAASQTMGAPKSTPTVVKSPITQQAGTHPIIGSVSPGKPKTTAAPATPTKHTSTGTSKTPAISSSAGKLVK